MSRMVGTPMAFFPTCSYLPATVSDRLAFLNYLAGSLAGTLSVKLNTARIPLKGLRDNEVTLFQKRNVRNGLEYQISRAENSQERGHEKRAEELRGQLAKAESDDEPLEKQHEILLRKALKESELQKFQALREVIKYCGLGKYSSHRSLFFLVRREAFYPRSGSRVCARCYSVSTPFDNPALHWRGGDRFYPCIPAVCIG
jgi:hypothetical protein